MTDKQQIERIQSLLARVLVLRRMVAETEAELRDATARAEGAVALDAGDAHAA